MCKRGFKIGLGSILNSVNENLKDREEWSFAMSITVEVFNKVTNKVTLHTS
jgi:hypothetical protein